MSKMFCPAKKKVRRPYHHHSLIVTELWKLAWRNKINHIKVLQNTKVEKKCEHEERKKAKGKPLTPIKATCLSLFFLLI